MSLVIDVLEILFKELKSGKSTLRKVQIWITLAAALVAVPFAIYDTSKKEKDRQSNLVYHKQIESLNNVENNIKDLLAFVEIQKKQLRQSQDVLTELKKEEQNLRPIVETDRGVVNAILEAQAKQTKQDLWKDRGIGFALGILASLIASILFSAIRKVRQDKKDAE